MFLEFDWVAVPKSLWLRVLENDKDAFKEVAKYVHNLFVYEHALTILDPENYVVVTIADLEMRGIVFGVRLHANDRELS